MSSVFENAKKQIDSVASLLTEDYPDKKRFGRAIRLLVESQKVFRLTDRNTTMPVVRLREESASTLKFRKMR